MYYSYVLLKPLKLSIKLLRWQLIVSSQLGGIRSHDHQLSVNTSRLYWLEVWYQALDWNGMCLYRNHSIPLCSNFPKLLFLVSLGTLRHPYMLLLRLDLCATWPWRYVYDYPSVLKKAMFHFRCCIQAQEVLVVRVSVQWSSLPAYIPFPNAIGRPSVSTCRLLCFCSWRIEIVSSAYHREGFFAEVDCNCCMHTCHGIFSALPLYDVCLTRKKCYMAVKHKIRLSLIKITIFGRTPLGQQHS